MIKKFVDSILGHVCAWKSILAKIWPRSWWQKHSKRLKFDEFCIWQKQAHWPKIETWLRVYSNVISLELLTLVLIPHFLKRKILAAKPREKFVFVLISSQEISKNTCMYYKMSLNTPIFLGQLKFYDRVFYFARLGTHPLHDCNLRSKNWTFTDKFSL